MCGIAGIYGALPGKIKDTALDVLAGELAHRGPDGHGSYEDAAIGLAHMRLSIIDLSANGNQPLYNEDRSLVLICNGEIYNYREIRENLIRKGHRFSSDSDSEVILHLYEDCTARPSGGRVTGADSGLATLLDGLTGMFAFALWDIPRQRLFIARDRLGIKPLYYGFESGLLVFASEVKAIARTGLVSADVDITSLYEFFLLGSIPGPNTLFQAIKCLPPGHFLTITGNALTLTEYWDVPVGRRKWRDETEVVDEVEQLLSVVVKDHLVADVPVGTFLSAGIDSSLITAVAVERHPGIHSFTASFPGEPEDEGVTAAETAAKLATTHHAYAMKKNFFQDFTEQLALIDQPFAPTSALSLGRISRMAREVVKVVLSGDGGDELFGGYTRYEAPAKPAFLKFIPAFLQDQALAALAKLTRRQSIETLRQTLRLSEAEVFYGRITQATPEAVIRLFPEAAAAKIDKTRFLRRLEQLFAGRKDTDKLNRALYADVKTILVDEMLTKCDRMTMINGIEGRVPLLDHRMVALAFSIPSMYKRKDGMGKIILRKILARKLGNTLAFRVKTGFNAPLKQWLGTDAQTIAFVKNELKQAASLPFLDPQTIGAYERAPHEFDAVLVYSLVCVSQYFSAHGPR